MKVLGLTGGIGMGKSACADLLRQRGIRVIDTDDLAHEAVLPGKPALRAIEQAFGPEYILEGGLNRQLMAQRIFSDPQARQRLEAILHPEIREAWQAQVRQWRQEGAALAVVVIPLLFETHAERELDAVICVACTEKTQAQRVRGRGWSEQQLQQRVASQWPVVKKIEAANFLIWSEGGLDLHAAQLERILARFQ
ncbi:MAG TPA: dephospho-CoA kinase [Clostridia bacterium]|nr:dephospho-CoA kinase [Clostridia bacterium]